MGQGTACVLNSYGAQVGLNSHIDSGSNGAVGEVKALGGDAEFSMQADLPGGLRLSRLVTNSMTG